MEEGSKGGHFEPIFGFELKIEPSESDKVGPYIIGTLGVHKDPQAREAEYKKKRNEILDKINSNPSKDKKEKSLWQEDDPVMDQQFPLAFAKSLFYYKRTTFNDKSTLYSKPDAEDEIDQDKRMKWKVESTFKRQIDYFKEVARYSPIRNLRECREPNCMFHRISKPIVRNLFEQTIVDEAKSMKHSKSDQSDFVYTSYLCDFLLQDLVAVTKLSEKIGSRCLRVNLIDTRYKQWLAKSRDAQFVQSKQSQKQSSNVLHIKPSVKLEEQFFRLERDKLPPLQEKQDDKDEELDKAAQILVINDTLYQFTEWMHNYASYRVSSLKVILYDDPGSYLEECKISESAKSDIIASAVCGCQSEAGIKQATNDVTQLVETLKSTGAIVKLVSGEQKISEKENGLTADVNSSSIKLAIIDSNSDVRKFYDFGKRTWNNFIQRKPNSPSRKNRSPPSQQPRSRPPAFQPPEWASPLTTQNGVYVLQVIKDSKQIDSIPFSQNGKLYFLLGRSADLCDIELANPLISRQHAAIVFNKEEEPYIIDLNSAHGTFLDSAKLEPYTPMPLQEGSILKFGTSSRKYILLRKPNTDTELLRSETKEEATLDSEDSETREQADEYDNDVQSPEDSSSLDSNPNESTSKKRDPMSISSLLAGGQEKTSAEEFETAFFVTKKPRSK